MLPYLVAGFILLARTSFYDPSTCDVAPINCANPAHWWRMAGGADARLWWNRATACPAQFPLWTQFTIKGSRFGLADGSYTCLDRGGMVKMTEQGAVLDLLRHTPVWAESILVVVNLPEAGQPDLVVPDASGDY